LAEDFNTGTGSDMAGNDISELTDRLEGIEAQIAIADLIHEYARLVRSDEPAKVPALFTVDCVFEVRDGHPDNPEFTVRSRHEGRDALEAFYSPMKGQPHPVPIIHNLMIDVQGDTANANMLMDAQVYGTAHRLSGEYHDTFRREEGRWLFASRIFTMFACSTI